MSVPLALYYGHSRADENPALYRHLVERMATVIDRRMAADPVGTRRYLSPFCANTLS
jgi:hypothetical protein